MSSMNKNLTIKGYFSLILFGLAFSLISCQGGGTKEKSGKLNIVCTTGMIADAVTNLAGDHAEVSALMGPGVDPHLYKATQGDLARLTEADIIFYNGLHLEGKMADVFEKLARTKPTIAFSNGVNKERFLNNANFAESFDPHIWFDVSIWTEAAAYAATVLQEQDPEHAAEYQANADKLSREYNDLHQWVKDEIATIPQEGRVMVTAHDAFEYFGRAYEIEVRGLQGISTMSEYGLQDVTKLVDFIVERKIKAVFVESSVPRKSLEAVVEGCKARGHEVSIGGTLFSDAMGEANSPEGTYPGMVKANVNTIVNALR
ncbi:MAG: zinc ABC transporter substrate-binding protein [Bacteroidia bacterium]|nr:zinc ABC transporter substrate-binding protein [Bacteroidia bacterium]